MALTKRELSRVEAEDLVAGATILGVGGGGSPDEGFGSLIDVMDRGGHLILADLDEFDDNDFLASPYFVGSVAPTKRKEGKRPASVVRDPVAAAVSLLESKLGKKVAGTVATELGGGNTAACLAIAGRLGIPMVDGDLMGRAGPELHQSTTQIFGFSMAPSAIVSETGDRILVESYASIDDYEAIARHASVVAGSRRRCRFTSHQDRSQGLRHLGNDFEMHRHRQDEAPGGKGEQGPRFCRSRSTGKRPAAFEGESEEIHLERREGVPVRRGDSRRGRQVEGKEVQKLDKERTYHRLDER